MKLPGFKAAADGYIIDKCKIDATEWNSGFITYDGFDLSFWLTEKKRELET